MAFTDHMIYRQHCLLLATLRFEDSRCILNSVCDLKLDEVPKNSIRILQVRESQCTAWVVAIPKQLSIANGEFLCLVMSFCDSFIQPFPKSDNTPAQRFTFEQQKTEITKSLSSLGEKCHKAYIIYCPARPGVEDPE